MAQETFTLYGIPNCDTCRKARRWLEDNGASYRFHDVRKDGMDIQTLERWSDRVDVEKLLNKRSTSWRQLSDTKKSDLSRSKVLALLLENPTLIRRPVLESKLVTATGFSETGYRKILDTLKGAKKT